MIRLMQLLILLIFMVGGTYCEQVKFPRSGKIEKSMSKIPTVLVKADIEANVGEQVHLVGYYTQIDVRMHPDPPPVYKGHIALVLEDDTNVLLHAVWDTEAKRPAEEIAQFENRKVVAEGLIFPTCPDGPNNEANLRLPCLLTVDSINLVP